MYISPILFLKNRSYWRFFLLVLWIVPAIHSFAQEEVIPLYSGVAPGSEQWDWEEGVTTNTPIKLRIVYNVKQPTLSVYRPDSANGAAVLLIPGGGYYVINIESEGNMLARQLVKKGITVFVLKYRTGRTLSGDPWPEMLNNLKDTSNRQKLASVHPLIIADAFTAMRYLRNHAPEYDFNPNKIGVIGFSAGGSLALKLCTTDKHEARPDFAGLIYTVYRPAANDTMPATVPPVFIACASDDVLASPANSTALFGAWLKAERPAELHIYAKGGHGLWQSKSAGNWLRRFEEWLEEIGMMK